MGLNWSVLMMFTILGITIINYCWMVYNHEKNIEVPLIGSIGVLLMMAVVLRLTL